MKTIIAGTDFTPSSLNACRYAALLAQRLNCRLTIFNLFEAPVLHSNSGLYGISYASVRKTSETRTLKVIQDLNTDFPSLKINCLTTSGAFVEELENFVGLHQVMAVVLGLEYKTRIAKFIWGSHSVNIAGKINAPVIIVPEKYKEHHFETVVLAVDNLKKLHASSLKNVEKFIKAGKTQVKVIHVRTPEDVIAPEQVTTLKISGSRKDIEVRKSGSVEKGIKKYCEESKTDLVTIISKKHSVFYNLFNESVTKRVAFAAKVPVMAIHE
jgi:nucleotide-binding universal stress UspA family protein